MIIKNDTSGLPVWERPDLFLPVPSQTWGYVSAKDRKSHIVAGEDELKLELRKDHDENIHLVWMPGMTNMEVPEAIPRLFQQVKESRVRSHLLTLVDESGRIKWGLMIFSFYGFYSVYQSFTSAPAFGLMEHLLAWVKSSNFTLGLLLFVMFAAFPWYESRKRWKEVKEWTEEGMREAGRLVRFETWLAGQKIVVTRGLLGLLGLIYALQFFSGSKATAAALLSDRLDERWRLLSAPLMHGHPLHFMMNALGLLYLGRRIEALARWPHVILVFLFSAWIGGECSILRLASLRVPTAALGASGGLMGMLGFLLVFETLHRRLVPRSARARLITAMVSTAIIGIVGIKFIDNAAHAGGLVAGMIYAATVFPKSDSVIRPKVMVQERYLAYAASAFLLYGAWKVVESIFFI